MFGGLPDRTALVRQRRVHEYLADRLLAEAGLMNVIDSSPIELLVPIRDGRSAQQVGKKGRAEQAPTAWDEANVTENRLKLAGRE